MPDHLRGQPTHFNSQPHKEADRQEHWRATCKPYFNSQPHKEADDIEIYVKDLKRHFNSQPHKEADHSFIILSKNGYISTHSLTRRLTAISDKNIFIQN